MKAQYSKLNNVKKQSQVVVNGKKQMRWLTESNTYNNLMAMLVILFALFIVSASIGQFYIQISDVYKFIFNLNTEQS